MKTKKYIVIGMLAVFVILVSNFVSAFAVSSEYYNENPLELSVGETKDIYITLQNLASTEDVYLKAEITDGVEVIQLADASDRYTVPGEGKTRVNFRVKIPSDAKIGDIYPVTLTFTTIPTDTSGALGIGSSIGQKFNVVVREEPQVSVPELEEPQLAPEVSNTVWIVLVVTAIIVIIIIWWFLKRKK